MPSHGDSHSTRSTRRRDGQRNRTLNSAGRAALHASSTATGKHLSPYSTASWLAVVELQLVSEEWNGARRGQSGAGLIRSPKNPTLKPTPAPREVDQASSHSPSPSSRTDPQRAVPQHLKICTWLIYGTSGSLTRHVQQRGIVLRPKLAGRSWPSKHPKFLHALLTAWRARRIPCDTAGLCWCECSVLRATSARRQGEAALGPPPAWQ